MDSIVKKVRNFGAVFSAQGNVYLVLEGDTLILNPSWVKRTCSKYETDGIVLLKDISLSNDRMRKYVRAEYLIYNPDGSYALISGNGLASASAYILRYKGFSGELLLFFNDYIESTVIPNKESGFFVGFRKTDFVNPFRIPFPESLGLPSDLEAYYLEMPNEHLVVLLEGYDNDLSTLNLDRIVEVIKRETDLDANISLVRPIVEEKSSLEQGVREILARGKYQVRVWERGVGETGSCGSAAAAITNLLVNLGANLPEYKFCMPGGVIKTLYTDPMIYIESKPELLREVKIY